MCFNFATEHQRTAVSVTVPTHTVQGQHYNKPKCQQAQSEKNSGLLLEMRKVVFCFFVYFPHSFTSDRITAHLTCWLIISLVRFGSLLFS